MMLSPPMVGLPAPRVLSTMTPDLTGIAGLTSGVAGSTTWPAAGRALLYPVSVARWRTLIKAFWLNGATAAGNVDVGIYTVAGTTATLLGASTAQAQAGISGIQVATTFTTLTIPPGLYYLAMSCSLATATIWRAQPNQSLLKPSGCYEISSGAHPLPSSATVSAISSGMIPVFGFSENSVI